MRKAIDILVGSLLLTVIFVVLSAWWVSNPAGRAWMTDGVIIVPPAGSSTWIHSLDGHRLAELDAGGTL